MKFSKPYFISLSLCLLFCSWTVRGVKVGSASAPSTQFTTFFPKSETNNEMTGFTVLEYGFTLEDSSTTCSFNTYFPLAGDITLNGGTLYLLRDLELKNPFALGPGTVSGKFALEFPGNVSGLSIPSENHTKLLTLVGSDSLGAIIASADWSYDDKYLAVGLYGVDGNSELKIYYFDDTTLTMTFSQDFSTRNIYSVNWHPSDYYLAIGQSADTQLKIYYLNIPSGTLDNTSSASPGDVRAVSWSPTGSHVAIGRASQSNLIVYDVASGVLGSSYQGVMGTARTVQNNALDWDSTGSYLAVGLDALPSDAEIKVFYFDGATLTENAEIEVGCVVYAVRWHPQNSLLVVGLDLSAERLRLYEHNSGAGTLTEKTSAQVGDGQTVYALDWSADGIYPAVGRSATSLNHELRIFAFDSGATDFSLSAGYTTNYDVKAVSWTHDGDFIAVGDSNGALKILKPELQALIFRDVELFLKSDVTFRGPVRFEGTCLVNGAGNRFSFAGDGSIAVASGSSLLLEDVVLRGVSSGNIYCVDDTAVLTLRDLEWYQDSAYSFSGGGLRFENTVKMFGEATFAYQSVQTCTILANSKLKLDTGFTFSYDPTSSTSKTLFEFVDKTSVLHLNGATLHTTVTGLELTKGTLILKGECTIGSEIEGSGAFPIDEGITFGNGIEADDVTCKIAAGTTLNVVAGSLVYKNIASTSWNMLNSLSTLQLSANTKLVLQESLDLGAGVLKIGGRSRVDLTDGKDLLGSVYMIS